MVRCCAGRGGIIIFLAASAQIGKLGAGLIELRISAPGGGAQVGKCVRDGLGAGVEDGALGILGRQLPRRQALHRPRGYGGPRPG
jgi:hypothetical protein